MTNKPFESSLIEGVALIGFRLNPDSESSDLFTLMAYGDRDFPVQQAGRIVFFCDVALVPVAFKCFPDEITRGLQPPLEAQLVCDLARALHIIETRDCDDSATVLNCLNTLFDLVTASGLYWPNRYKHVLYSLADHLTFQQEFLAFLEQRGVTRRRIIDAFLWCIGAVSVKAKLIS